MHAEHLVESDARRLRDEEALGPDGTGDPAAQGLCHDVAVEQPRYGAETRKGAVDEQLGPDLTADGIRQAYLGNVGEHMRQGARAWKCRAVGFTEDEGREGCLRDVSRSQVGGSPLHRAHDEVPSAGDVLDAVLHESVAQRDVGVDQVPLDEWQ